MVCLRIVGTLALSLAAISLCACGTVVPNIKEVWDSDIPESKDSKGNAVQPVPGAGQIEFEIKRSVFCELRNAVYAINGYTQHKTGETPKPALPNDWTALVSLSLEVDESSSLNPGVALNVPMANAIAAFGVIGKTPVTTSTPQAFSLGFGATLSSTATRIDKFDPSWTINFLSQPPPTDDAEHPYICDPKHDIIKVNAEKNNVNPARSSPLITRDPGLNVTSDLGLKDWLLGATAANNYLYSVVGPPVPEEGELTVERKFLAVDGFKAKDITTIVASGANKDDVTSLEKLGYTHKDILSYLSAGASLSQLQQLKQEGYNQSEINKIVTAAKSSGAKQQAPAGTGGQAADTISIEIKFVIVTNGNVTPTWKLLRVSANTGSAPLAGLGRTRTHDLIITIGPPGQATANTHLASQIGNAVSNGNHSLLAPQTSNTFNPFGF